MKPSTRKQAIARKQSKYFTGKPCKNGHIALRNTIVGNCVECARESQRVEVKRIKALFSQG